MGSFLNTYKILNNEHAVYPGHPVTVAYVITQVYPNLEEALKTTQWGWPDALSNEDVPGAGGCVYMALELLKKIDEGMGFEAAYDWAESAWYRLCKNENRNSIPGQDQADNFWPLLVESEWYKKNI